mmetsp:Transcript_32376/g.48826  ORF Transcript_32376/g.48826 Transcript_32376/m.48826 type:complete len:226 (+) Transcript_32376:149-826(+)
MSPSAQTNYLSQSQRILVVAMAMASVSSAFTIQCPSSKTISTQLNMGLFDGVKDAFSAPPSDIDAERETPIDRWMGWSVTKEDENTNANSVPDDNFVDAMDGSNYVTVFLDKPMGIIFEENDEETGGIFIQSLTEGGAAAESNSLKEGDQLVAVDGQKVSGKTFDESLGTIVDCETTPTPLLLFRGTAEQLYGPTGASQEWLEEFISTSMSSSSIKKETEAEATS